jgi:hypothetical protein
MPVREAERRLDNDLDPETAPPENEAPETKFSDEGDLPEVAEAKTDTAQSASEQAFDEAPQPDDTAYLDTGMHEVEEYRDSCAAANKPEKWDDNYIEGHTDAKQFTQPYQQRASMTFSLKKGQSASQAVKDFIAGRTIADYRAIGVALELDELRDDLGDVKFDQLFGSRNEQEDAGVPHEHRLQISSAMYTTPFVDQMKAIAAEYDAGPEQDEVLPPPVEEQVEDKPKQSDLAEDPIIVAEDLGKQPERELL